MSGVGGVGGEVGGVGVLPAARVLGALRSSVGEGGWEKGVWKLRERGNRDVVEKGGEMRARD